MIYIFFLNEFFNAHFQNTFYPVMHTILLSPEFARFHVQTTQMISYIICGIQFISCTVYRDLFFIDISLYRTGLKFTKILWYVFIFRLYLYCDTIYFWKISVDFILFTKDIDIYINEIGF